MYAARTLIIIGLLILCSGRGALAQCCGDCNGNGAVTIDEIVGTVNRSLGLSTCDVAAVGCPFNFADVTRNRVCRFVAEGGGCRWLMVWDAFPAQNGATGNAVRAVLFNEHSDERHLIAVAFSTSFTAAGVGVITNDSQIPLFVTYGGYVSMDPEGFSLHVDLGYDIEVAANTGRLSRPRPSLNGCTLPASLTGSLLDVYEF